uniref:Uncharacterized protein n=1 Tax=Amazona collaria TaxID=241587 RepID=A0A8B9FIN2_9PSIT
MKMLPGVGVAEGFSIEVLWGKTNEEAKQLAEEMNIFYTSQTDDVLLHQDVDLGCTCWRNPSTWHRREEMLGTAGGIQQDGLGEGVWETRDDTANWLSREVGANCMIL